LKSRLECSAGLPLIVAQGHLKKNDGGSPLDAKVEVILSFKVADTCHVLAEGFGGARRGR
jgi:hypothetical protein